MLPLSSKSLSTTQGSGKPRFSYPRLSPIAAPVRSVSPFLLAVPNSRLAPPEHLSRRGADHAGGFAFHLAGPCWGGCVGAGRRTRSGRWAVGGWGEGRDTPVPSGHPGRVSFPLHAGKGASPWATGGRASLFPPQVAQSFPPGARAHTPQN